MTQYEFDAMPLLLQAGDARRVVGPWLKRRKFYELREGGFLRVFQPDPGHVFAYYLKCDLGKMAALTVSTAFLERLPEAVPELLFRVYSGLSELALRQALASKQLRNVGKGPHVLVPRSEFSRWLLTGNGDSGKREA